MMYCRTYLAAHWLSDTVEGALVGGGIGLLLWWIFEPSLTRDRDRPFRLLRPFQLPRPARPDRDDANAPVPAGTPPVPAGTPPVGQLARRPVSR